MKTKEAANKWQISERRIRALCASKSVPGAVLKGKTWIIPDDAVKPNDLRFKNNSSGKKILVVGSFVKDLTVSTNRIPNEGESVAGESFTTANGGKGANQAVQIARLGANCTMVGAIGEDTFGDSILSAMNRERINTDHVVTFNSSTGVALITLNKDELGNTLNRIVFIPGANNLLKVDDVKFLNDSISNYSYLILQYEIPNEVNECVAKLAHEHGVKVIINPAPSRPTSDKLLQLTDYYIPNEHEFFDLTGYNPINNSEIDELSIKKGADLLLSKGVKNIIITLGKRGCCLINKQSLNFYQSIKNVKSIDPTAAGDSFIGAFAAFLAKGFSEDDAILLANAVGSLTVQKLGAQPSLCHADELKKYLLSLKDQRFDEIRKYRLTNL